ncbi:hypothetical protein Acr_00g0005330 [Actinidia rufa]|uniref:Uncharacterized protein n=1 Tax=Actinidia rufa TaxID=165716 RepID=A0A7J0D9I0_9ERIC|nr:hypothetical protein Acr_00g0005330 [Actinidia rufa]
MISPKVAYHTTSRIPTGETPYSMVFGTESVIPVEIGMPSFRTSNFDKESNEAELKLNLDLLEERRENAELRQAAYKCQVAKYYNQRVKHRSFLPGDLVLRRVTLSTKEPNAGKLSPTWEGPYKVIKVSRPGTYCCEKIDVANIKIANSLQNDRHLDRVINVANIKIANSLQNDKGILIAVIDVANIKIVNSLQNDKGILIAVIDVANIKIANSLQNDRHPDRR